MPQRKVEVYPNESRGLPERKSRSTRTKVEVYPNAPVLGIAERGSDIYAESAPRLGRRSGRRKGRSDEEVPAILPSVLALPGFGKRSACCADGRRVSRMEGTQVWDEVE